jgi:trimeric autotransporter adhesin
MSNSNSFLAVVVVASIFISAPSTRLAQAQLTEFGWNGSSGSQDWQQNGNWDTSGFPNDPLHYANLSVDLESNLALSLGGNVTVAGLNIGGSSSAVTTEIVPGGSLRLQNDFSEDQADADFNNNSIVDGGDFLIWQRGFSMIDQENNNHGDADGNSVVNGLDLGIWQANFGNYSPGLNSGRAIITTGQAAGSTNLINANIHLPNEVVDVRGFTNLTIGGNLSYNGGGLSYDKSDNSDKPNPDDAEIGASISIISAGITTTINGNISINDPSAGAFGDFGLNTSQSSQGMLVVNGQITGSGANSELHIGVGVNDAIRPLSTVQLNSANSYSTGTVVRRANIEVADDAAFGTGGIRQDGMKQQLGYNIIPIGGDRTLANDINIFEWQTIKGDQNLTLTGRVTQENNRGIINLLSAGKTLTISGELSIWGDNEDLGITRQFDFDGTGTTLITGSIADLQEPSEEEIDDHRIHKSGTGVLIIDVAAGANNHVGPTTVEMGNFHYVNNDSLNSGAGRILSRGGAIGVDTGVNGNTNFLHKIDPESTGGLMLAPSDSAASLDFTGAMSNAGGMTVAAPASGLVFTGSITPANSTYGFGGGTGTLTLPNAQLSGTNKVEIRNGGTVELLGDNTYTGSTKIMTRYSTTHQEQAEANSNDINDASEQLYDRLVAPILVVDNLADGGTASSIGAASSDAANLEIQGSTLKYVGTGDSTNRLFTIGTGGATIDASGSGAVMFTNVGEIGIKNITNVLGDVDDWTGSNHPTFLYNVTDTSDILIGMPVNDPEPELLGDFTLGKCDGANGENCIPLVEDANGNLPHQVGYDPGTAVPLTVTVTSISSDGQELGISAEYPWVSKLQTVLVFGNLERTLTLAGDNPGDNTIAPVISDSDAGGVVALDKTGPGKWVLAGNNTYTGDTTVEEGILSITNTYLDDSSTVSIMNDGTLDLDFTGTDAIATLILNGARQEPGLWGAFGNGAATFTSGLITGGGLLDVGGAALSSPAQVPEPSTLLLTALAVLGMTGSRKRVGR